MTGVEGASSPGRADPAGSAVGPTRRRTIASAGGLRGGAILLRAAVGLVLARFLGASEVGVFFLAVAVGGLVALICRAGLDRLALAEVGRQPDAARAITRSLGRHILLTSTAGAVAGVALALVVPLPAELDRAALVAAIAAVVPLNLVQLAASVLRGAKRTTSSLLVGELAPPLLRLLTFAILPLTMSASRASVAFLLGWVGAAALGVGAVLRLGPDRDARSWALADPWRQTGPLFTFSLSSQLRETAVTGIGWVAGTPAEVGGLGTASRLEQMSLLPTSATRFVTAPELVSQGSALTPATVALAVRTARKALALQLPILAAVGLLAPDLLGLLGADFRSAAPFLRVMILGALVNGLTGSTTQVLLMSDHRRRLARSSTMGLIVLLVVSPVVTAFVGVVGVAIGLAAANATIGLVEWWYIRADLGVRVDVFAPLGDRG